MASGGWPHPTRSCLSMKLKPPFTKLALRLDLPAGKPANRVVLPFNRNLVIIIVVAIFDIIFTIPAITTFQEAAENWGNIDNLFNLVIAIFLSGWLLGWSLAPLVLTTILILLLFGHEVITVRPGRLCIGIGIPGIMFEIQYDAERVRNLRHVLPDKQSGTSWRGPHLVFDYGSQEIAFGSSMQEYHVSEFTLLIESYSGTQIREGAAMPETLAEEKRINQEIDEASRQQAGELSHEVAETSEPVTLSSPSTLALIIANLVPLLGSLFFGWRLADVMVIYWAESAIIGFYNILKIAWISGWLVIPAGALFIGHFGAFMAVHFLFIYGFFIEGFQNTSSGGDLLEVMQLFLDLWPALAALFISHGISFVRNFIGKREYLGRTTSDQMGEPYNRIIFMHITLIFGGGITLFLGEPTLVLLVVIAAKIYIDIKAHIKQRQPLTHDDSVTFADGDSDGGGD